MSWRVALLSALGVVCALATATPAVAGAHATVVASVPADEARLASSPSQVTVTFDETISLGADAAQVISADGRRADDGRVHLAAGGRTLVIGVRPDLPTGSYSATWRVISADTHVVTGSIVFGVRSDPGAPPAPRAAVPTSLTMTDRVVHGLLYGGLVGSVGLACVALLLQPRWLRWRRVAWAIGVSWVLSLLACIAGIWIQGAAATNVGLTHLADTAVWRTGLHVEHSALLRTRAVLVAAAAVVIALAGRISRWPRVWPVLLGAWTSAIAVTVALDGHAGVGEYVWLSVAVTTAHILAMLMWLGGLALLSLILLRRSTFEGDDPITGAAMTAPAVAAATSVATTVETDGSGEPERDVLPATVLNRWSGLAFAMVVILVVSGEYQAWRQITPVQALWSTDYGVLLVIKIACVAAMLALASRARRRCDPKRLRRTVPIEALVGIAVIVVTSVLVTEPPARTTFGPRVQLTAPLAAGAAHVTIQSTRRGATTIVVALDDAHQRPLLAESMRAVAGSQSAGIPSLSVRFVALEPQESADGSRRSARWSSVGAVLPVAGSWTLTLTVQFSEADAQVSAVDFPVW